MSYVTNDEVWYKKASETRNGLVSFADMLDQDGYVNERISSITSVSASGLTITSTAITAVPRRIGGPRGIEVPAGKAIQFTVSGGTNGTEYSILCVVVTTGGQTLDRTQTLSVTLT